MHPDSLQEYLAFCKLYGSGWFNFSSGQNSGSSLCLINAFSRMSLRHYDSNVDSLQASVEFQDPEFTIEGTSYPLSELLPSAAPLLDNDTACSAFELVLNHRICTVAFDLKNSDDYLVYEGTQLQLLVELVYGSHVNLLTLDNVWDQVEFISQRLDK